MANHTVYPFGSTGGRVTSGDFSNEAKLCLLETLGKVAWIDENGQDYIDDLQEILFKGTRLVSISAVFTPGDALIVDNAPLDFLKQFLVVTATFSDETTATVYNYELSGTLVGGQSANVTVTYLGLTTTFSVASVHNFASLLSNWIFHPSRSVSEYTNGKIRLKCNNTNDYNDYKVWCCDAKKTKWSAVNGKTMKVRLKVNDTSLGALGVGIYASSSISSLGNDYSLRANISSFTLAEDGYYEATFVCDQSNFTFGGLTPDSNSTFGVFAYSHSQSSYLEIYDVQVLEVTS